MATGRPILPGHYVTSGTGYVLPQDATLVRVLATLVAGGTAFSLGLNDSAATMPLLKLDSGTTNDLAQSVEMNIPLKMGDKVWAVSSGCFLIFG